MIPDILKASDGRLIVKGDPIGILRNSGYDTAEIEILCSQWTTGQAIKMFFMNGGAKCQECGSDLEMWYDPKPFVCKNCRRNRKTANQKKTFIDKYGVDSPSKVPSISKRIHSNVDYRARAEKTKKTLMDRYGVDNISKLDSAKETKKMTLLKNHNVSSTFELGHNIEACKNTKHKKRLNKLKSLFKDSDNILLEKVHSLYFDDKVRCEDLRDLVGYGSASYWRNKFSDNDMRYRRKGSDAQSAIADLLRAELGVVVEENNRKIIHPKEIDIFLPEYNVAIEYNGIYWHKDDDKRHAEKRKLCSDAGVKLYQFWSNIDPEMIVSMIASKIGKSKTVIGARKCQIREISSADYRNFVETHHLQSYVAASVKLGLFYNENLVAVMSFGKSRYDRSQYEMYRFCNKTHTSVMGGFSKLWKHFVKVYQPSSVVTYADAMISDGKIYNDNGFVYSHTSKPNYWYTQDFVTLESRVKYQKHKLKNLLQSYNDNLSERENMLVNNFHRVYDAGNLVYRYKAEQDNV